MTRAFLFAGFDPDGIVDDTVVAFAAELARHGDVYYLADCELPESELAKLAGVTRGAWAVRHGAYDFGSYALLARELVGWDRLEAYDEVILVNDSCYLVGSFDAVFARMDAQEVDFWGLQATAEPAGLPGMATVARPVTWRGGATVEALAEPLTGEAWERLRDEIVAGPRHEFHLGSFFVAVRAPVIAHPEFRAFVEGIGRLEDKFAVIDRYEYGLTRTLLACSGRWATFVEGLYPFHPVYNEWAFAFLRRGFPLLKRAVLTENPFHLDLADWRETVRAAWPDADLAAIEAHAGRLAPPALVPGGDDADAQLFQAVAAALPPRVDALFVVPWMRLGGADKLTARYLRAVRALRPEWTVVLLAIHEPSTHLHTVPEGVVVVDVGGSDLRRFLDPDRMARLVANVAVLARPELVHLFDNPDAFLAVDRFGALMARRSRIFLTTYYVSRGEDGSERSFLLGRSPSFLDHVRGVITDNSVMADRVCELAGFDRAKFFVHHQDAELDLPFRPAASAPRRKVFWSGKLDRPKRPDVLAAVAARLKERGVDAEIHYYQSGLRWAWDPTAALAALDAAGAVQHGPYESFADLPLDEFALSLITSEAEGVPQLLLEVTMAGLPVVAPLVGGIPDVLDESRGFPVSATEAVDEYVARIEEVLADPEAAEAKARRARAFVEREFSTAAWLQRVIDTPGYLAP